LCCRRLGLYCTLQIYIDAWKGPILPLKDLTFNKDPEPETKISSR